MGKPRRSQLSQCKSRRFLLASILSFAATFCPPAYASHPNVAYFAGGCYWCTEAVFQQAPGVTSVISGYMQKAETVQVTFDPAKTNYEKLLRLHFTMALTVATIFYALSRRVPVPKSLSAIVIVGMC